MNFTAGATEFSIITTPVLPVPGIGTLPNSPLGGTKIAQLNNYTANNSVTKLSQTFTLNANPVYFSYAGVAQTGTHSCCDQAGFTIVVRDYFSGNVINCNSIHFDGNCSNSTYTTSSGNLQWTGWQTKYIDLSFAQTNVVTLEVIVNDCPAGDHYSTLFFDATSQYFPPGTIICFPIIWQPMNFQVNACAGSTLATITGPAGYVGYTWTAPPQYSVNPIVQNGLQNVQIANPIAGSNFTLTVANSNGCTNVGTTSITVSNINISGIASGPSCPQGASGSATVVAGGSAGTYSYNWTGPNNISAGTTSVVGNLSPGIYNVTVSVPGNTFCGTAQASVQVSSAPNIPTQLARVFCSGQPAYITAPAGSNYQWYTGTSSVSAGQGGTAPSFTYTNPATSAIIRVGYLSPQGCRDSVIYTLIAYNGSSITVSPAGPVCSGQTNASAMMSLTPVAPGTYTTILSQTGISPPNSNTITHTSNTLQLSGLSAGSVYSIVTFDGFCYYSNSYTVSSISVNYSLNPGSTLSVCPGNPRAASVTFSNISQNQQHTYSWTPSNYLLTSSNAQNVIIGPGLISGTSSTIIYTVTVTSTLGTCSASKTLAVTILNPSPVVIAPIPSLCSSAPPFSVSANPSSGVVFSGGGISSQGVISPSVGFAGINTFSYSQSGCVTGTGTYTIIQSPALVISGNTSICQGQSTTFSLSGGSTYSLNGLPCNSTVTLAPAVSNTYTFFSSSGVCTSQRIVTLSVVPYPTINIAGQTSVCPGSTASLTVSGGLTYSWSNGSTNATYTSTPTQSAVVSVTAYNSPQCFSAGSKTLHVFPQPTLVVQGRADLCQGDTARISLSGLQTYSLNYLPTPGNFTLSVPASSAIAVSGTDNNGCMTGTLLYISVANCTGLREAAFSTIYCHPVPSADEIKINNVGRCVFEIRDELGRVVKTGRLEQDGKINIADLAEGLYLLRLPTPEGLHTDLKIIKTHE